MNITDLTKPMPDEKSRAYRVPVDPAWFQERDCVVIETIPASQADLTLSESLSWMNRAVSAAISK